MSEEDFITMSDLGNHIECPFCPQKDAKLADLEAKLAESEKENKRISSWNLSHSIYVDKKIEQLKQQLAAKDIVIERLTQTIDKLKNKKNIGKSVANVIVDVYEPMYKSKCDEVKDLEQQLEWEKQNYAQLESDYKKANELGLEPSYIKRVIKENAELKQQLAEKEKEKDYYQDLYFNAVRKQERTNKVVEQFQQRVKHFSEQDQSKTEFAIQQLQRAKEKIANHTQELWTCEDDDIDLKLYEEIDQIIKKLSEEI